MNFIKYKTQHKVATLFLVIMLAGFGLLVMGCYNNNTGETGILGIADLKFPAFPETGSHAVVVFSEMHYSPAYDDQEGPTIGPPSDSVPVTGREIKYTADEYTLLRMSDKSTNSYDQEKAADLYRVNCTVCHGESLQGDGAAAKYLTRGAAPANLLGGSSVDATEGEIFAWISYGSRTGFALEMAGQPNPTVMPTFNKLLTEDERWHLVKYIMAKQNR
ncbi:MAG: cytochrome c [SAR202 cluster bacterium]|nr:cytochrome c [SAR202 cluster bacterium]|tara:strand:+ start:160134 stop:160787 length:654 start_codon:yes stop_codon:yes gene_type:complete